MICIKSGLDFQNILNTDVNVSLLTALFSFTILSAVGRKFNKVKSLPQVKWHVIRSGFRLQEVSTT